MDDSIKINCGSESFEADRLKGEEFHSRLGCCSTWCENISLLMRPRLGASLQVEAVDRSKSKPLL